MRVTHDNLWLCHDCHFAAAGVDETIVDQGQAKAVEAGLTRLAKLGHLVPDYDSNDGDGVDAEEVEAVRAVDHGALTPFRRRSRTREIHGSTGGVG